MFSCRQNAFLLSPDSRQERTTRSICSSVCFMITVFHKAKHKLPSCKDVLARVLTMSMVWWIPTEYWRISLKDYGGISQETIEQVEILFEDYLVLWACDLSVNPDGTMNFASEEEIGKSITVLVGDSLEYFPLADDQIDAEVLTVAESMKPIFAQTLGQMGQGLHYYFFKVKDEEDR